VVAVQVGEHPRHLRSEGAQQRQFGVLEHGDLGPGGAGGGGGFQANPARADDHDLGARSERGLQVVAVIEVAQVMHTVEVGAGHRQPAWRGTGGEEQLVVAQSAPVTGHELVVTAVDRGHHGVESEVHLVLGVPLRRVHVDRVALRAALQVSLGQRWPLVGPVRFGPEQDDASVETVGAQRFGGLGAGQARADDGERAGVAHVGPSSPPPRFAAASLCPRVSASAAQDAWKVVRPSCSSLRIASS
jgi:hypothetical protein